MVWKRGFPIFVLFSFSMRHRCGSVHAEDMYGYMLPPSLSVSLPTLLDTSSGQFLPIWRVLGPCQQLQHQQGFVFNNAAHGVSICIVCGVWCVVCVVWVWMLPSPSGPLTLPYTHTHTVSRYNILYTHRHYTHKRTHVVCTHTTIYLPILCVYLPSPFTTLPPHFSPSFTCPEGLATHNFLVQDFWFQLWFRDFNSDFMISTKISDYSDFRFLLSQPSEQHDFSSQLISRQISDFNI